MEIDSQNASASHAAVAAWPADRSTRYSAYQWHVNTVAVNVAILSLHLRTGIKTPWPASERATGTSRIDEREKPVCELKTKTTVMSRVPQWKSTSGEHKKAFKR
jgi:hypothetical protein